MPAPKDEYARGRAEGEIREKLASHDRRLDAINGQLGTVAGRLTDLVLMVQRVADQTTASGETQRIVQQAVTARAQQAWAPWQRTLAVLGGLGVLVGAVVSIVVLARGT
jgi:hypothetical protein